MSKEAAWRRYFRTVFLDMPKVLVVSLMLLPACLSIKIWRIDPMVLLLFAIVLFLLCRKKQHASQTHKINFSIGGSISPVDRG